MIDLQRGLADLSHNEDPFPFSHVDDSSDIDRHGRKLDAVKL